MNKGNQFLFAGLFLHTVNLIHHSINTIWPASQVNIFLKSILISNFLCPETHYCDCMFRMSKISTETALKSCCNV